MQISRFIEEFLAPRNLRYKSYRSIARKMLVGGKDYSLNMQPEYENSENLPANIRQSVQAYTRSKDAAIRMYKDFILFLRERGADADVAFPPIPVDSSFERQMFIAKYLQDGNAKIDDLPDMLWVGKSTVESDLQRLRGKSDDPIQICGHRFVIDETERHKGKLHFASTVHPLFLTENLTQVILMLKGLKAMSGNPMFRAYAEATAAEIWEQLSDYAKRRIRFVLHELLPEDLSWYEELYEKDREESSFSTERQCSINGNVWLDCLKNGKTFYAEYREDGGTVFYEECRILPRGYSAEGGTFRLEVECRQGRKTLFSDRILRSCYTAEELAAD